MRKTRRRNGNVNIVVVMNLASRKRFMIKAVLVSWREPITCCASRLC